MNQRKIATWNVNSIRMRLNALLEWLAETQVDIVLLQETKVEDRLFPREPLEDQGYNIVTWGQKAYNGVAILSKYPLEDVQKGLPALHGHEHARYLEAFTGGFRVASLYVPNGQEVGSDNHHFKKQFFEALTLRTRELLSYEERVILGGDYNVAPQDTDVYAPEAWREKNLCSTPERGWFRSLLYSGLIDPLDQASSPEDKNPYTWWDYRHQAFARQAGLRIDHFLLSAHAGDCLDRAYVDTRWRAIDKASDHAPVVGIFNAL